MLAFVFGPAWSEVRDIHLTSLTCNTGHRLDVSALVPHLNHTEEGQQDFSEWPCRNIMLWQDELALMNAISTLHISFLRVSPVLLKELRLAMARRTKKPVAPAGYRSTTPGSMTRASQKFAGMQKANELATSVETMELANNLALNPRLCTPNHQLRANELL